MQNDIGFHFEQVYWLWGLILPVLLWWLPRAQLREDLFDRLKHYADDHLLPYLVIQNNEESQKTKHLFFIWSLLWSLVILAMAGPRWDYKEIHIFEPSTSLVILLDISRSMEGADVRPSRLARARQEIEDFLEQGDQMKIGLIAFASIAHVVSPITDDHHTIRHLLPALSVNLNRLQGSRLSDALSRGARLLSGQPDGNAKAMLLVSDGDFDESGLIEQVQHLTQSGIHVYTMGIGDEQGATIPDGKSGWIKNKMGKRVISKLNVKGLEKIAETGKGIYVQADYRGKDTRLLHQQIQMNMPAPKVQENSIRVWHERFYWLILLMLPFVLNRFRQVRMVNQ